MPNEETWPWRRAIFVVVIRCVLFTSLGALAIAGLQALAP